MRAWTVLEATVRYLKEVWTGEVCDSDSEGDDGNVEQVASVKVEPGDDGDVEEVAPDSVGNDGDVEGATLK